MAAEAYLSIYRTEGETESFGTVASNVSQKLMKGDYEALVKRQLAGETSYPTATDPHMEQCVMEPRPP